MIVSLELPLPKLEPDDWNKWWNIWNNYSQPLRKIRISPNAKQGLHIGFDVIREETFATTYEAVFLNLEELYPSLFNQIKGLPIRILCARFVQSKGHFPAHVDNFRKSWQIRNMFYCQDPISQWYYTDLENRNKKYLTFSNTNWWAYLDGSIKHGSEYREQFPKIILQVFSLASETSEYIEKYINTAESKLEYDNNSSV